MPWLAWHWLLGNVAPTGHATTLCNLGTPTWHRERLSKDYDRVRSCGVEERFRRKGFVDKVDGRQIRLEVDDGSRTVMIEK